VARWLSLFVVLLFTVPASAQSPADLRAARELFREGLAHANAGRWEEARTEFERSYEIAPRLPTLLNLAGAQVQTGRIVAGVESYRRFISEAQGGRERQFVPQAETALAAAEARVAHIVVRATVGEGERLTLDGEELSAASIGTAVPVDPGAHTLVLSRGDDERSRRTLTLAEGAREEIVLDTVELRVDRAEPDAPAQTARPSSGGDDLGLIVGVTIAVVLAVAAAVAVGVYFGLEGSGQPYTGNLGPGMITFE
jgi:hypothetical protein